MTSLHLSNYTSPVDSECNPSLTCVLYVSSCTPAHTPVHAGLLQAQTGSC